MSEEKWVWQVPKRYQMRRAIRNVSVYKTETSQHSLHSAASCGLVKELEFILLHHPCFVDETDRRGITPLHYAARSGNLACVQLLLQHNANLFHLTRTSKSNILHSAARSGNLPLINFLIEEIKAKSDAFTTLAFTPNKNGKLPSHCAAQSGDLETFVHLIEMDSDFKKESQAHDGRTFHHFAAERGHFPLVCYLYQNDFVQVEKSTDLFHDIIHHAARSGNLELVKHVITEFEKYRQQTLPLPVKFKENKMMWTALHFAAESWHPEVAKYFLENDLEVNRTYIIENQTPLGCAAKSGCLPMVRLLVEHGASLRPPCSQPLLFCAAVGGNVEILSLFLEKGLNDQLTLVTREKQQTMHIFYCAIDSGDDEILSYLCEKIMPSTPELNNILTSELFTSPLEHACQVGNLPAVQYLLHNNYYPNDTYTCLKAAARARYLDILELLLDSLYPLGTDAAQKLKEEHISILRQVSSWCENISFLVKLIESYGLDPNEFKANGTSLMEALFAGNVSAVDLFLSDKYKPVSHDFLLHAAAMSGNLALVKKVITAMPEVKDTKNTSYHTSPYGYLYPLHFAVLSQSLEVVQFFVNELNHPVTILSDPSEISVLHLAAAKPICYSTEQEEILHFLVIAGAHILLTSKASSFPGISGSALTPCDVAATQKLRNILEKYSPMIYAQRFLVDRNTFDQELTNFYGKGKHGIVYKAEYLRLPVAIKFIPMEREDSARLQSEMDFLLEVGLMSSVRHPNLCMIIAASMDDKGFYVIMERLSCSLADYLQKEKMDTYRIRKLGKDICRGMIALHLNEIPIIHRDLKPANVLLDKNLRAKIADFGVANFGFIHSCIYDRIIPDGTIQCTELEDVYAFGLCLLAMAIPHSSLSHKYYLETLDIQSMNPVVRTIIERCCQSNRKDRYQSFFEVLEAIKTIDPALKEEKKSGNEFSVSLTPPRNDTKQEAGVYLLSALEP